MSGPAHKLKLLFPLSLVMIISCSFEVADTGSGTNVGNSVVLGVIQDQDGSPAANTRVLLLPSNYNPVSNPVIPPEYIDTTDINGHYNFTFNRIGSYNIEAEHPDKKTKLLIHNIDVKENDTVTAQTEMLRKTGAIRVVLPDSVSDGFIYIPGTTIKQNVEYVRGRADTVVLQSVPAGKIPVINYVQSGTVDNPLPIGTDVTVTPGDTTNADSESEFTISRILFTESFDDTDLISNGWYDDVDPVLSTAEHVENSVSSLEYRFLSGDTVPVGGTAMRRLFEETDSVYISFYVKYSTNWQGGINGAGASAIVLLTNKDSEWIGPWYNSLSVHIEQDSGVPLVYLCDAMNIDESNIGVDLTDITEFRAVAGCNGDCDGYGPGECYEGPEHHSNYKPFKKDNNYFQSTPGKYYKSEWHFIEVFVKLNSISGNKGVADGVIKYWYDGGLVMNYDHVMFRTNEHADMKFRQLIMAPSVGLSPIDQTLWIDKLTVAR